MNLLGWNVDVNWVWFAFLTSVVLVSLCAHTMWLSLRMVDCDKFCRLLKMDKKILTAVKYLTIFQISMTIIGSFFFDLIFNHLVENILIAFFLLLVVWFCKILLKEAEE